MMAYYDRVGNLLDTQRWVELRADEAYSIVARTEVSPDVIVSTAWIGIDYGQGPAVTSFIESLQNPPETYKPIIFETMVFRNGRCSGCRRYATKADALAGHDSVVAEVSAGLAK